MSGQPASVDRRRFLAQVTLSVGGVALSGASLAGIVPVSLLEVAPCAYADPCGDWNVDDMCGAYPPYAFDTGPARAHTIPSESVDGVDWHWIS